MLPLEQETNMFSHLNIDSALIPALKKRIGTKYHHLYSFLYSSFSSGISPYFFQNMEKTVELILIGIKKRATFYILGDKDADGVSAISVLKLYLESQECKVFYNMPLDNETYGSSPRMITDILSKKKELYAVITVDTGIKEHILALELNKYKIPLIITDHHTPDETLPDTPYIINPHLNKEQFFPLCGAYVALKLVQGIFLRLSLEYSKKTLVLYYSSKQNKLYYTPIIEKVFIPCKENQILQENNKEVLLPLLKEAHQLFTTQQTYNYLVAEYKTELQGIPEVHIVEKLDKQYKPLIHPEKPKTFFPQNPTYSLLLFAQEWLQSQKLNIEKHLSLYIQIAGIATICDRMPMNHFENRGIVKTAFELFFKDKNHPFYSLLKSKNTLLEFTTHTVPMLLCPLLNAGGRLGKANIVVDFLSSSEEHREKMSKKLMELNKERQKKQKLGLQEVESFLLLESKLPYIFYASENIHKGVTGIIANKISKSYQKPTFILSIQKENAMAVGSARSPFPVHSILESMKDILINFGGHQKACGFTISIENKTHLEKYLDNTHWEYSEEEKIEEESYPLEIRNCSHNFYRSLELLDPYGEEHQQPIFKVQMDILNPEVFGKNNNHLKWTDQSFYQTQFIYWKALQILPIEELQGKNKWVYFTVQKNSFYQNRYDLIVQHLQ